MFSEMTRKRADCASRPEPAMRNEAWSGSSEAMTKSLQRGQQHLMEYPLDIRVQRVAAVDVAFLHHFLFEADRIAGNGRLPTIAFGRRHRRREFLARRHDVRRIGRRHRDLRLIENFREGLNVLGVVAGRVGVGDVVGDQGLARGQPLRLLRRQLEKVNLRQTAPRGTTSLKPIRRVLPEAGVAIRRGPIYGAADVLWTPPETFVRDDRHSSWAAASRRSGPPSKPPPFPQYRARRKRDRRAAGE